MSKPTSSPESVSPDTDRPRIREAKYASWNNHVHNRVTTSFIGADNSRRFESPSRCSDACSARQRKNSAARSDDSTAELGATMTRRTFPARPRCRPCVSRCSRRCRARTPSLERMLDTADELAVGGFIADAEHVLRRALELYPAHVEPKRELARLALETNDARRALHISLRAIEHHPNDLELHGMAAAAYERLGAWIEASNHLAAVLAADSVNILANRRMAPILDRLGDRDGAIDCLRRLVAATQGRDLDAMTALGDRAVRKRRARRGDSAARPTWRAHRADSGSAQADLAMALLSAGRLDEAIAGFSEALRLDPRSAQAYCGLGLAYQQLERWLEAAESFKIAEELAPDTAVGPFNLGLALAELGRPEEARRALLRAAALAPDDGEIRAALEALPPPPAAPAPAAAAPVPRFIGDIKSFALPEVLEFLRLQHKTGSLVVSSRRGAGIVRLVKGQVTSASAPGVGRLGEALVARGIITRRAARRGAGPAASRRQRRRRRRLGDARRSADPRASRRSRTAQARRVSAGAGCAGGDARLERGRLLFPSRG